MQLMEKIELKDGKEMFIYTEEQLMARLKFFIGICLALTLTGIVFVVLYSLIFVTQPMNAIAPIDQKFFELIIPIATFLTGTLSGIMLAGGDKDLKAKALDAANKGGSPSPGTPNPSLGSSGFNASFSPGKGFTASGTIGGSSFDVSKSPASPSAFGAAPGSAPAVNRPPAAKPFDDDVELPVRDE
jgi:hypothetical protein